MRAGLVSTLCVVTMLFAGCVAPTNETAPDTPGASTTEDEGNGLSEPFDTDSETSEDVEETTPTRTLKVHYVNVGQGDGTIWELPDGSVIVYDCGPAAGSSATNPMNQALRSLGLDPDAHIHALVASHGHLDHIGGCEEILEEYYVDHLYDTWYAGSDAPSSYTQFRDQVRAEGGVIHNLVDDTGLAGDVRFSQWESIALPAGAASSGVKVEIIWPSHFEGDSWDEIAESSIAVRLSLGTVDFCFQGDVEAAQEATLASYARGLNCEVYLVGHHGSRYASSAAWLAKMDPEHAIVSFGDNGYGHPTADALCRVQAAGAAVYATHRVGNIMLETDGSHVSVSPGSRESLDYCVAGTDYWSGASATSPPVPDPEPESPASPPAPSGALTVSASVSDSDPCQYTTVTISVHVQNSTGAPVNAASVETTWHYKSSTPTEAATTNGSGDSSVSRGISSATAGHEVVVDVEATAGSASGSASTSFTPVDC